MYKKLEEEIRVGSPQNICSNDIANSQLASAALSGLDFVLNQDNRPMLAIKSLERSKRGQQPSQGREGSDKYRESNEGSQDEYIVIQRYLTRGRTSTEQPIKTIETKPEEPFKVSTVEYSSSIIASAQESNVGQSSKRNRPTDRPPMKLKGTD